MTERYGETLLFGEAFYAASCCDYHFQLASSPVTRENLVCGIERIGSAVASTSCG